MIEYSEILKFVCEFLSFPNALKRKKKLFLLVNYLFKIY
jgi:hypothetical protein